MSERILPKDAHLVPPEAERVFEGEIYDVYHWPQKLFDGSVKTFEMLKRPDTVMIIALDESGQVIVNDEEQPGGIVRKNHLPVGRMEPGESPLAAAQRELHEETGWEFGDWELLDVVQMEKKIEWFTYLFIARRALRRSTQNLDTGERIATKSVPVEEVLRQDSLLRYFPWLAGVMVVDDLMPQATVITGPTVEVGAVQATQGSTGAGL